MPRTKWATCPTCHRSGPFKDNGKQRWPRAVAAAHGLPAVITLWTCPYCRTTLCKTELLPSEPVRD
jgi:hypothetical protein